MDYSWKMKMIVFHLATRKYATLSGFNIYNTIIVMKYSVHDINYIVYLPYAILIYDDWKTWYRLIMNKMKLSLANRTV